MRNFIFCARNLEDYLSPLNKFAEEDAFDVKDKRLLETKTVQNLFQSIIKKGFKVEKCLDEPISDFIKTGIDGVKLDFNVGLRLEIPSGNWRVKISDADSGIVYFHRYISDTRLNSLENYYINWKIEIFRDDQKVFDYELDLNDKPVLVFISIIAMGDTISMLPYIDEFRRQHNCKLSVYLPKYLREFAEHLYPEIIYEEEITYKHYATYLLYMPSSIFPICPAEIRNYPLGQISGLMLGLNVIADKPKFKPTMPPLTHDPYVCISVQASHPKKGWLYPDGWDIVVDYLKSLGYRVFCIDKWAETEKDGIIINKPAAAEDATGDFSIMHRANMLYYAKFFIGLSSGLAWVADAVDCPVVMICGFSMNWFEFYTPYRVANRMICNGCLNDTHVNYMKANCPYHEKTEREFECQKKISPKQVINAIEKLIVKEYLMPLDDACFKFD